MSYKIFEKNKEFLKNLNWLYENDYERFNFIKTLISYGESDDKTSASVSLNDTAMTVTVEIGEYMYQEKFETLEKSHKLVAMIRSILSN